MYMDSFEVKGNRRSIHIITTSSVKSKISDFTELVVIMCLFDGNMIESQIWSLYF